jgi:hypothetical protein
MFAKLAQQLTNARRTEPRHRPAAPLRLVVNRQSEATKHPGRGRLVCRWWAMPGRAGLACAWEIEVPDNLAQPIRLAKRPAAFLLVGDERQGPLCSRALGSPPNPGG